VHVIGGEIALSYLTSQLRIHPVARRLFGDRTPFSVVNHLDWDSFIATGNTILLEEGELISQRLACYCRGAFVLSSEFELLRKQPNSGSSLSSMSSTSSRRIFDNVSARLTGASSFPEDEIPMCIVLLLFMELSRAMVDVSVGFSKCLVSLQRAISLRWSSHENQMKIIRDLHNVQVSCFAIRFVLFDVLSSF
jgi:hypothetical protein